MTEHQKKVKQYYLAALKAERKSCKYCTWSSGYYLLHCELKDKSFDMFFRIRASLCKYYDPE